jgi:homoserine O-succinyltransferase
MAMINHFHGIQKHMLQKKAFGCFRHQNLAPSSPYLRGFSDDFVVPVSRWTEMKQKEIDAVKELRTLLGSDNTGPCLIEDLKHRALYIFNHFEYDSITLKQEYDRDTQIGKEINIPGHYYLNNDPTQRPLNRWRSHAHLLYGNWINEIYQSTPFDQNEIGI